MNWLKKIFRQLSAEAEDHAGEEKDQRAIELESSLYDLNRPIKLQSSDNKMFRVSREVACQMKVVQIMVSDQTDEGEKACTFFPLPNVNSSILKRVIEYCERHANDTSPEKKDDDLNRWDSEFVSYVIDDSRDLVVHHMELLMAAHYLEMDGLQTLMCKTLAKELQGRSVEEMRLIFGVDNDYTSEEEAALREDNKWEFR